MTKRLLKNFLKSLVVGIVIAFFTSIFTFATATVSLSYALTNLGTLGGNYSEAFGINDAGIVVGDSSPSNTSSMLGFVWQEGTMNYLMPNSPLTQPHPMDINNIGQVVCNTYSPGHVSGKKAFVLWWQSGNIADIDPSGETTSLAQSINDKGQVAVWELVGRSYLWEKGNKILLGSLGGGSSSAFGINNAGQVVGRSTIISESSHAFLWEKGKMKDLGLLGGNYSEARSINKAAQVVGYSSINNNSPSYVHAFLWENPKMKDLGTLGGNNSSALAINNWGTIVGKSEIISGVEHAFVWKNRRMTDLNSLLPTNSGWELTVANAINNRGQIVGKGKFNGQTRAFLLTPVMVTN